LAVYLHSIRLTRPSRQLLPELLMPLAARWPQRSLATSPWRPRCRWLWKDCIQAAVNQAWPEIFAQERP